MTDETIANVPILILGNKIDRPEAISEERLREMFGLYGQTTGKVILFFYFFVRDLVLALYICVGSSPLQLHKSFFVYYILSSL